MTCPPRTVQTLLGLTTLILIFGTGCATKTTGSQAPADAIYVEGETVVPTGSRISQTVKKGKPAGVAPGMAGAVTGGKGIEQTQNDVMSAGQLSPGHGPE